MNTGTGETDISYKDFSEHKMLPLRTESAAAEGAFVFLIL